MQYNMVYSGVSDFSLFNYQKDWMDFFSPKGDSEDKFGNDYLNSI